MRILLTSNASYRPPRGGSTRSNLLWLDYLTAHGHECRIVAAADTGSGVTVSDEGRLRVYSVAELGQRPVVLREQICSWQPDWVLVSSEDLGHVLLREAARQVPGRYVYLAHTPQFFPFGPESWNPDPRGTELVREAAGVVVIGEHMAGYVEQHVGRKPEVIHPPMYGPGPFRACGSFDNKFVLMINPSTVKGLPIFAALAERMPTVQFAALVGWGTSATDRATLAALSNVTLLGSVPNIEEVLCRARVLLMPSLWYEGFGLIVMEAMLRGVPVISSDSGGLVEAKQGTSFVIPVQPIARYEPVFDEHHLPRPVVPGQDVSPWKDALELLLTDRDTWQRESLASRAAALSFVAGLNAGPLEAYLLALTARPVPSSPLPQAISPALAALSPDRRALLLQRLRRR